MILPPHPDLARVTCSAEFNNLVEHVKRELQVSIVPNFKRLDRLLGPPPPPVVAPLRRVQLPQRRMDPPPPLRRTRPRLHCDQGKSHRDTTSKQQILHVQVSVSAVQYGFPAYCKRDVGAVFDQASCVWVSSFRPLRLRGRGATSTTTSANATTGAAGLRRLPLRLLRRRDAA
jgi:hypothetical protein